ncbi:MAG TPA: glycosyltransferase, partial [Candidatus Kapabacteria bacterium]|nr:glycosyltransferase [Candidatus Kapabacteria bacterium]
MLYWEHEFTVEVRKRSNNNTVKSSAVTHQPHTIQTEKENDVYALILHLYYPAFLEKHYKQFPNLSNAPIEIQKDSLIASRFGDSDFYSKNLHSHGWKTQDLILNAAPIQALWAQAHHIHTTSGLEISIAQIRAEKPSVVYFHDISIATKEYIEAIRPFVALIVGQIACPLFEGTYYHGFDILISSLPHFVERFRAMGIKSYYQPLAFESSLFTDIIPYHTRPVTCSFVGGISPIHTNSLRLLELLATTTDCEFWGYGAESLPPTSPIRAKHHGEVWGMDMFMTLQQSKITVNRHGAFAEDYANNMRLFEATGCGALLITDHKSNIEDLFVIGKEIITYSTPEECAEYVRYYSSHPEEAEIIAEAGRQRTLRDHSYHLRMNKTSQWLKRHLRYQSEDFSAVNIPISQVSSGHTFIDTKDLDDSLLNGWKNPDIPLRQRALVHNELQELYKGSPSRVYSIAAESMRYHLKNGSSLLEIGCSSGYYSEVLEYVLGKTFQYSGIDISESFIAMAKDYYPECSFTVADAKNLPFPKASFDIVFSSGAILYEIDYGKHIQETSRVARNVLIYHRTPICKKTSTQLLKKKAYNVETVERIFNEQEFLSLIIAEGWHLES